MAKAKGFADAMAATERRPGHPLKAAAVLAMVEDTDDREAFDDVMGRRAGGKYVVSSRQVADALNWYLKHVVGSTERISEGAITKYRAKTYTDD